MFYHNQNKQKGKTSFIHLPKNGGKEKSTLLPDMTLHGVYVSTQIQKQLTVFITLYAKK